MFGFTKFCCYLLFPYHTQTIHTQVHTTPSNSFFLLVSSFEARVNWWCPTQTVRKTYVQV